MGLKAKIYFFREIQRENIWRDSQAIILLNHDFLAKPGQNIHSHKYPMTQKLPQICAVILRIRIGKIA